MPKRSSLMIGMLWIVGPILCLGLLGHAAGFFGTIYCRGQSNTRVAEAQMKNFRGAIEQYRSVHEGLAPSSLSVLAAPDSRNYDDSYIEELPLDPWGRSYRYGTDGESYTIVCLGKDGVVGGGDHDKDLIAIEP